MDFYFFKYVRTFLKKNIQIFYFFGGAFAPHQKTSRVWEFFLGLVDPSRNRLVSTAYFTKPGFSVLQYISISFDAYIKIKNNIFFFKNGQIYMTGTQSAESNRLNRLKEKSNFRFLFFELLSFFGHFCDVITPIFN